MESPLLTALNRLKSFQPQSFISPLPIRGRSRVLSVQGGIPLWYTVSFEPGWFELVPESRKEALVGREAYLHEIDDYLRELPSFYCYVTRPAGEMAWYATPFNLADGLQRGWGEEEKIVSLVTSSLQPLDLIRARSAAGLLLFEKMDDSGLQFQNGSGKRYATQLVHEMAERLKAEAEARAREEVARRRKLTIEGRIQAELEYSGATLESYHLNRDGTYSVTYSHNGLVWTFPEVDLDDPDRIRIEVPGMCWAGSERHHNLASAVVKMEEARRQHRSELDRRYYL